MRNLTVKTIYFIFLTMVLSLTPLASYGDEFAFLNFSWSDSNDVVKAKMQKNGFGIRSDFDTSSPEFMEVMDGLPETNPYKKEMGEIKAELPANLQFHIYAGMGPADSPAQFGTFCVSNPINKLVFYNIKVNSDFRDKMEQMLVEKYGEPSVKTDDYTLWKKGNEQLFFIAKREILYLNEDQLKQGISSMKGGVSAAVSSKNDSLKSIFLTSCENIICFQNIPWGATVETISPLLKKSNYEVRNPEMGRFEFPPFEEKEILSPMEKLANPSVLGNEAFVVKVPGYNSDEKIPVGKFSFHFSTLTNKLLYYIVEIRDGSQEQTYSLLDSAIGASKKHDCGKYWAKAPIYIFNISTKLLYLHKQNASEHIDIVTKKAEKAGNKQNDQIKKMF